MATASNPTASTKLGLAALKAAGISSLGIGVATAVTVFAVQAAVVAGKVLIADSKTLANSFKS